MNSFWILVSCVFKGDLWNTFLFSSVLAHADRWDASIHPLWKQFSRESSWSPCDCIPPLHPTSAQLSHPHPQSQEVSVWACWPRLLWLRWPRPHQTPPAEPNAGWDPGLIASLQHLWLQRSQSLRPLYFIFSIFFLFLSFFKLAKDEVTMLQWVIHLEFMFSGSYFHLRAYLLVGCLYVRFMSHVARLCFSCFFFLTHPVHTSFLQHLQYLLFSGWGDFFFQ